MRNPTYKNHVPDNVWAERMAEFQAQRNDILAAAAQGPTVHFIQKISLAKVGPERPASAFGQYLREALRQ